MNPGDLDPINVHQEVSLLGSAAQRWTGFRIDWLQAGPATPPMRNVELDVPVLCMIDEGTATASFGLGSRSCEYDLGVGSIGFFAAGTHIRHSRWTCRSVKRIAIQIDFDRLAAMGLETAVRPSALATCLEFHDAPLAGLLRGMVREVATGSTHGALFAESLSVGVVARLATSLGAQTGVLADKARLSRDQVRRLEELVDAQMDKGLALGQLAAAAGYSNAHFVRLCRNTFGCTPHQYVMRARLKRTHELLVLGTLSLSEIAATVGFSSQSHMSSSFVAAFGVTPGAVRRECGLRTWSG